MERIEFIKHMAFLGEKLLQEQKEDKMARKKKDADGTDTNDSQNPLAGKKWAKLLSSEWMTTAESWTTDEIKKKIVQWEQAIGQSEKDMDADHALNGLKDRMAELKEQIKDTSEVYTKTISEVQAQIKYVVHLLDTRGVSVK